MKTAASDLNLILICIHEQAEVSSHHPHISYGTLVNMVQSEIPVKYIGILLKQTIDDGYVEIKEIERYGPNDNPFGSPTDNYMGYAINGKGLRFLAKGGYVAEDELEILLRKAKISKSFYETYWYIWPTVGFIIGYISHRFIGWP